MFFNIAVSAKKWQVLLAVHGILSRWGQLTRCYLTGLFFSNFLPSTIGGDGYRMYRIYKLHQSKAGAVIPVIFERLSGMVVLLFLGGLAGAVSFMHLGDKVSKIGFLFGFGGTALALLVAGLGCNRRFQEWIESLSFIPKILKSLFGQLDLYKKQPKLIVQCFLFTIIFYLFLFSYRYLMLRAVGGSCSFYSLALVTMLSTLIANLPVSINGIGLMDGSFIYLISKFGVEYEAALMVMLLQRALTAAVSMIGGFFYLRDKDSLPEADSRIEAVKQLKESLP
jgi:uncharacterized protein (TIRG00374 family)